MKSGLKVVSSVLDGDKTTDTSVLTFNQTSLGKQPEKLGRKKKMFIKPLAILKRSDNIYTIQFLRDLFHPHVINNKMFLHNNLHFISKNNAPRIYLTIFLRLKANPCGIHCFIVRGTWYLRHCKGVRTLSCIISAISYVNNADII